MQYIWIIVSNDAGEMARNGLYAFVEKQAGLGCRYGGTEEKRFRQILADKKSSRLKLVTYDTIGEKIKKIDKIFFFLSSP